MTSIDYKKAEEFASRQALGTGENINLLELVSRLVGIQSQTVNSHILAARARNVDVDSSVVKKMFSDINY